MHEAMRVRGGLDLIGMEPREARLYEHLAKVGPKDAAAVALGLGVTRGQAYRVLALLARRGHVALEATQPVTYRAVDPGEHVQVARIAEGRRASALAAARSAFLGAVSAAQAERSFAGAAWKVRRVTGRHSFHAAARRLILKARTNVLISYAACASEIDERARKTLFEVAQRKGSEGVHVRIVSSVPSVPGLPRGFEAPTFFVIDGRECLFLSSDPGPIPQGCWTSMGPLVAVARMLHDELWQASRP